MLGASAKDMLEYEVNRQKYNPAQVPEAPKARVEQPDVRDILRTQRSVLHKILRHIGLEN